ncbi:flavin-containing monooxygenase 1-like [Liolophura sinensis]|uniref:flavin-containing monooxygenase 1-like n=1 Tax=Liolophura sinensis TaxID=3198878 RepID=UPI003158212D
MSGRTVAVVGAGVSGIAAIKACLEEGLQPVCFEQFDYVGGLWRYTNDVVPGQGAVVYDSLLTNTSKSMTAFSDHPFPEDAPQYLRHEQVRQYLESYVEKFNLRQFIKLQHLVEEVRRSSRYDDVGSWYVTVRNQTTDERKTDEFDGVIICNGRQRAPVYPNIPGMTNFMGEQLHAIKYRNPRCVHHKNVLIIGNANTAGDIAVEASKVARSVVLSTGRGTWITRRLGPGRRPPPAGLRSQTCSPLLRDRHATFCDGSQMDGIDMVIYATGYKLQWEFLPSSILPADWAHLNLYRLVWPVDLPHPTLAVVGSSSVRGPVIPVYELQARWVAGVLSGRLSLPPTNVMRKEITQRKCVLTERYGYLKVSVDSLPYQDELVEELNLKPSFFSMLLTCPSDIIRWYLGPSFPMLYRLYGEHSWSGARSALDKALANARADQMKAAKRRSESGRKP